MPTGVDRLRADQIVATAAERHCLSALREAAKSEDGPIERHSLRVFVLVQMLARASGVVIDREVALAAALLHDIGLYPIASSARRFYLHDGRRYGERVLEPLGWDAARRKLCLDAVEFHHRLATQWDKGSEVELLRLADLVDSSGGRVNFGLPKRNLEQLFEKIPRHGLYKELARLSFRALPCISSAGLAVGINIAKRFPIPRLSYFAPLALTATGGAVAARLRKRRPKRRAEQ